MNAIKVHQCLDLQCTLKLGRHTFPQFFMEEVKAMAFSCAYIVNVYNWVFGNEY